MSKTTNRIITALFSVFIGGFFLLNLLLPDKDFSEKENRQLQTLPKFSFSSLFSGSFATRFESYCSDQFAGRDTWIETKAGAELAQGKQQNNGVFLCDGGRLIEPFEAPEEDVLARAVQAADLLTDTGVPVSLALIPTTAQLYADILPDGAPNDDQQAVINSAYAQTALETIDLSSTLTAHSSEYIFYRTDHHWTALGAYYAYTAFCESAGLKAEPLSKFESGEYTGFLGSLYSAIKAYPQSQALADNPDTVQFWRPFVDLDTKWYPDAEFSMEYFGGTLCKVDDTSNKYLTFLGGDHPITVIKTNVDGPVCMILKESYGNAFTPWLTSHYSKIIAIDPREFNRDGKPSLDLAAFAKEQGVNDCIVLDYPIMLNSDSYITWLERLVD